VKFSPTPLEGAYLIDLTPIEDPRGAFARIFCQREFANHNIEFAVAQSNLSRNTKAGTLRGLHYQSPPHEEAKLVRCPRGKIWDVIIDLRPHAITHGHWFSTELHGDRMLYIPKGLAHGFQTLEDNSDVEYLMSDFYVPEAATGLRWNDPAFNISWPISNPILSDRDLAYPDWTPDE
jgi:dTDP-4-dehydrorhamnose 3,5-epimerase